MLHPSYHKEGKIKSLKGGYEEDTAEAQPATSSLLGYFKVFKRGSHQLSAVN